MKKFVFFIVFAIVVIASALFFAQNDALVTIKYFSGTASWPMNWVLIAMIIIGFIFGVLSLLTSFIATKIRLSVVNKRLKLMEKEVENLRTLPIKDGY